MMEIYKIDTGNLKLDGGTMFGVVPKLMWEKSYPADENNLCNWAMRCMLVIDGERKILIDNGIGDKQSKRFFKNFYLNGDDSLEKSLLYHGLTTDDITDMILTHLHFDHCGGSIKYNKDKTELIPAFKNATYWIGNKHWNWSLTPGTRETASFLKNNILPIQESGQLKLVEKATELFPDFSVRFFDGHTEGQMIPFIRYKGKTIVYIADMLPSTAHIPLPWIMSYDSSPMTTMEEKKQFLNEAAENDYIFFLEHDLYHECCTVQKTEKGVRVKETFSFMEYFD